MKIKKYKLFLSIALQATLNYCQTPYSHHLHAYLAQFKRSITILDLTRHDNIDLMRELSAQGFDFTYVTFHAKSENVQDNVIVLKKFPSLIDIAIL